MARTLIPAWDLVKKPLTGYLAMTEALPTDVCSCFPDIRKILDDPSAHFWLKQSLATAIQADSVDVAIDAQTLADVLSRWCDHLISHHSPCA